MLFTLCTFAFLQNIKGQKSEYIFKHFNESDGLINNKVTSLLCDHEGYIWIGTQAGLQRYDGTRFQNFVTNINDSFALQSDWIATIYEDSKNRLWISNELGGIYLLDRISGKFQNYNLKKNQVPKISGVWQVTEDKSGTVWLASRDGFFKLDEEKNVFQLYNNSLGINPALLTSIMYADDHSNLWFSTSGGLKMYDQKEKKLYGSEYNPQHLKIFETKQNVSAIIRNGDTLWLFFVHHLERYIFSTKKLKKYYFTSDFKTSSFPQSGDQYLISAGKIKNGNIVVPFMMTGFAVYNAAADSFLLVKSDNTNINAYHNNETGEENIEIIQDKYDNIIIGNSSGLNITNPAKQLFFNIPENNNNISKFPRAIVSDFLQVPGGDIFLSYYKPNGGIVQMDSNLNFKKLFLLPLKNDELGVNQVWQLFLKDKHTIFAPNQAGTSLVLDLNRSVIQQNKDTLFKGLINSIKQDEGFTWFATWRNGLEKINSTEHKKIIYDSYIKKDDAYVNRVNAIYINGNKIWIGTLKYGLIELDKTTGKTIQVFNQNRKIPFSISSNCVNDVIAYNADTLVLATETGLNIFDIRSKKFITITTLEGLPNNFVLRLANDDLGNIWATCAGGGFCKINMKTLAVQSYSIQDGILNNAFNGIIYKLKNGRMLVGNSIGFMSFDPADFRVKRTSYSPAITGIYIFNKWWPVNLENKNKALEFAYDQNFIRLEFSILSILKEPGSKIFYRLNGLDKDWIQAGKSNDATYNNLTDGKYIFEVKAINRDGIESPVTSLALTVVPPFYKTWWFYLVAGSLIILMGISLIKRREKNIKLGETKKLQIQELKADQYRSRLELEKIINFFSSSLIDKNSVDDVVWDVATNLIGKFGFEDCIIYLWNEEKTRMVQKAGFGGKDSPEKIKTMILDVLPGQGIVGHVMQTKEPLIIPDTSIDERYRADDEIRASEIAVPVLHNGELIGVLDSEHSLKNFFTPQHLQILITVATLIGNKIVAIETQQSLQKQKMELHYINEQLYKTKLEALRSQMNPHFIFNSLNAIQECIVTGKVDAAYQYLSKFSKLQRMVLNHSEKELIPLKKEIEMLELYLDLESLRFSKSFTYHIELSNINQDEEVMVPSMITQPFVENALWHGLRNKPEKQFLKIIYTETENTLSITVADNGIGRAAAEKIKQDKLGMDQHESRGTILMQNRLSILERQLNIQIDLTITDECTKDGTPAGTTVHLTFPNNL